MTKFEALDVAYELLTKAAREVSGDRIAETLFEHFEDDQSPEFLEAYNIVQNALMNAKISVVWE